jgi:type I restriction enzyme S subunit
VSAYPQLSIDDFCETGSGGTPSRATKEYYGGNIPWVKSGELREGIITDTEEKITERAIQESSAKVVPNGAILLAMYGATVGRMAFLGVDAATNQAVCNIRPDPKRAYPRYVFHCLQSKINHFLSRAAGGAQPNISQGIIKETKIPLPPLDEQRRIAMILDKADALRRKRKCAIELLDGLVQSVFLEMFGHSAKDRTHFKLAQLTECCTSSDNIRCGPFGTQLYQSDFQHSGVPLWGIKHVNAQFNFPTVEFLSTTKAKELSNYDLLPGDLVMTRKGTIGNVAVYPSDAPNGVMHSDLLRVRLNKEIVLPQFMAAQLRFDPAIKHQISLISGGAIMAGINVGKLKSIRVLVPPIELQKEFVAVITQAKCLGTTQLRDLDLQEAIFCSLQSRAFSGRL